MISRIVNLFQKDFNVTLFYNVQKRNNNPSGNESMLVFLRASALSGAEDFDMVILPGGLPGSTNLDESPLVDKFVNRAVNEDKFLCASCAAPFILGKRGILKGKRACCYPSFEKELIGADISEDGCVRDGKIITARAMGKSHDFALEIIEALCGKDVRDNLAKSVLY